MWCVSECTHLLAHLCVYRHIKEALRLDEEGLKKQALDEYGKGGSHAWHTLIFKAAHPGHYS